MTNQKPFSDEKKAALLSNPYTFRITDYRIVHTLEFKKLVMENIDKPGMTYKKIFQLAGYDDDLFTKHYRIRTINRIKAEAASPEGLKAPKPVHSPASRKKHSETEFKELEERVKILEQQVEFLKKSHHIRKTGRPSPPSTSN